MQKYLIILLFFVLCTSGCGKKYKVTPDILPNAHVNQEYKQLIHISGGKVVDKYARLTTDIPEDLGITVKPESDLSSYGTPEDDVPNYNHIEIKGTPKHKGKYTITIEVSFFGGGGATINKTYMLKVE